MMNGLNAPTLDEFETDLNKSANISRQINLENFKEGRIGPREEKQGKKNKIDKKALKDALNLSYQVIYPEGDRKEQSIIEERATLRKSRGISPFGIGREVSPLVARNRGGKNSDSTTADNDSKPKPLRLHRLYSNGTELAFYTFR